MPDTDPPQPEYKDPRKEDIVYGDRRLSRPDTDFPDWYMPDAIYRPIPIAWFAAAILLHAVVITAIAIVLLASSAWLTLGLVIIASIGIYQWAWARGIGGAARGWQIAMAVVMTFHVGLVVLGVSDRF